MGADRIIRDMEEDYPLKKYEVKNLTTLTL
jgi:hypothetical protein